MRTPSFCLLCSLAVATVFPAARAASAVELLLRDAAAPAAPAEGKKAKKAKKADKAAAAEKTADAKEDNLGERLTKLLKGIEKGKDVNAADKKGTTPLMLACKLGNKEAVYYLLLRGADAAAKSKSGKTAADFTKDPALKKLLDLCARADADKTKVLSECKAEQPYTAVGIIPRYGVYGGTDTQQALERNLLYLRYHKAGDRSAADWGKVIAHTISGVYEGNCPVDALKVLYLGGVPVSTPVEKVSVVEYVAAAAGFENWPNATMSTADTMALERYLLELGADASQPTLLPRLFTGGSEELWAPLGTLFAEQGADWPAELPQAEQPVMHAAAATKPETLKLFEMLLNKGHAQEILEIIVPVSATSVPALELLAKHGGTALDPGRPCRRAMWSCVQECFSSVPTDKAAKLTLLCKMPGLNAKTDIDRLIVSVMTEAEEKSLPALTAAALDKHQREEFMKLAIERGYTKHLKALVQGQDGAFCAARVCASALRNGGVSDLLAGKACPTAEALAGAGLAWTNEHLVYFALSCAEGAELEPWMAWLEKQGVDFKAQGKALLAYGGEDSVPPMEALPLLEKRGVQIPAETYSRAFCAYLQRVPMRTPEQIKPLLPKVRDPKAQGRLYNLSVRGVLVGDVSAKTTPVKSVVIAALNSEDKKVDLPALEKTLKFLMKEGCSLNDITQGFARREPTTVLGMLKGNDRLAKDKEVQGVIALLEKLGAK